MVAAKEGPFRESTPGLRRPHIQLSGVGKRFEGERGHHALESIELAVREGEFLCLVGPSGCGKSTLLNLVAGLEQASAGTVEVSGKRVTGPGAERTVVFQDGALFPWLTVKQNVLFPLEQAGVPAAERAARVERTLRLVHLWRFRDALPHELSGGMRQRTALARALVVDPAILLLDEPFAALDAQMRGVLQKELERVWMETRKTVLFITHQMEEAVLLGDRVVVMGTRPGRVKEVVDIALPRPRDPTDPEVALLAASLARHLREEVEKVMREEVDDAWEPAKDALRPRDAWTVGGGI